MYLSSESISCTVNESLLRVMGHSDRFVLNLK